MYRVYRNASDILESTLDTVLVDPSYMVHYGGAYYKINPNPIINL